MNRISEINPKATPQQRVMYNALGRERNQQFNMHLVKSNFTRGTSTPSFSLTSVQLNLKMQDYMRANRGKRQLYDVVYDIDLDLHDYPEPTGERIHTDIDESQRQQLIVEKDKQTNISGTRTQTLACETVVRKLQGEQKKAYLKEFKDQGVQADEFVQLEAEWGDLRSKFESSQSKCTFKPANLKIVVDINSPEKLFCSKRTAVKITSDVFKLYERKFMVTQKLGKYPPKQDLKSKVSGPVWAPSFPIHCMQRGWDIVEVARIVNGTLCWGLSDKTINNLNSTCPVMAMRKYQVGVEKEKRLRKADADYKFHQFQMQQQQLEHKRYLEERAKDQAKLENQKFSGIKRSLSKATYDSWQFKRHPRQAQENALVQIPCTSTLSTPLIDEDLSFNNLSPD